MLVICNGALKSGSTWLFNILKSLMDFEQPPESYLTLRTPKHPCIRSEKLKEFLDNEDYRATHFLSKNHLGKPEFKRLLLSYQDVYVFDIARDLRDVVVSSYYHDCFRNGYQGDFEEYYWSIGRETAAMIARYHDVWRDSGPNVYISSYERLHKEFATEVSSIGAVLGVKLSEEDITRIQQQTSLYRLRNKYRDDPRFEGNKFFRKGEIGDWKNHFNEVLLSDLSKVEERGIGPFDILKVKKRLKQAFTKLRVF